MKRVCALCWNILTVEQNGLECLFPIVLHSIYTQTLAVYKFEIGT